MPNQRRVRDEDLDPETATQAEVDELTPQATPALPQVTTTDPALLAILAKMTQAVDAMTEQAKAGPIKQIPITEMDPTSVYNPEGLRKRPELTRKVFQNGALLHPSRLRNREIELLNVLKIGKYLDGRIFVSEANMGGSVPHLHINWNNKTMAQRIEISTIAGPRGFEALLEKMVEEGNRITLAA